MKKLQRELRVGNDSKRKRKGYGEVKEGIESGKDNKRKRKGYGE